MQRCVTSREHAPFADPEQTYLVDPVAFPDRLDAFRQIVVDVIVKCEPAVGPRWIAPIHHIKIDAKVKKIADERAVLLQIGHRVATDQPINDQHRRCDFLLGKWPVVMQ